MTPAHVVQITTPKKFILNGLWFGPKKPKRMIIFIHGLTGSAFSMQRLAQAFVDDRTAVLTFNNRGFEQIGEVKRKRAGKTEWVRAGAGHEIFTESDDDVQGAIDFVKKCGAKDIYLAGHSTGAQKIVYWASRKKENKVKRLILLGPLSDYSGAVAAKTKALIERGVAYAKKRIAAGQPQELMPAPFKEWFECDAQRYVSLYSGNSPEEIFTYADPSRRPKTLQKVSLPILVFLAGSDEHGDRPANEIAAWFEKNLVNKHKVLVVPKVGHGFKGAEKRVAKEIRTFTRTS